jgi:hypothetical protein
MLCIAHANDQTCPAPYTTAKLSIFTGFNDTRTCGTCMCGTPEQSCTGGKAAFSPNHDCTGGISTAVPMDCTLESIQATDQYYAQLTTAPTPVVGACTASSGPPGGTLVPTGPTTLCCM